MTDSNTQSPAAPIPRGLIPVPVYLRTKKLIHRFLPSAVFLAVCAVCAWLWTEKFQPTNFYGHVEVIKTNVSSPSGGMVTNLWVQLHQKVTANSVAAEIVTTDPRTVNSRLAVMRGQMQLTQLEMSPVLGQQRNALDFAQLVLNSSRTRVEVEIARANLEKARADLKRNEQLLKEGLNSEELVDFYRKTLGVYEAEVRTKTVLQSDIEKTLQRLSHLADTYVPGGENDPLRQALRVQEAQTRALEDKIRPLPLFCPQDGVVTQIYHRRGEEIAAGVPILTITSTKTERIIGQLPEYFPFTPEVGMPVTIRTRGYPRSMGVGKVLGFNPALEIDTNAVGRTAVPLPYRSVSISIPPELRLSPGQAVDLHLSR